MSTTARFATACIFALTASACDTLTETYEHTSQPGSVPIQEVVVDLNSGNVQVTGGRDAAGGGVTQVTSTATAHWYGEEPIVEFAQEGTTMRISALCRQADLCQVELQIEMPPGADLKIKGEKTDVSVTDLEGTATIDTEEGSIELTKLTGFFDVGTETGSILGSDLASARAFAETVQGSINLEWPSIAPFTVMADSERGDIALTVPDVAYRVEAKTGDGELDINVHQEIVNTRRFLHAIVTGSGDISMKPIR